MKGLSITDSEKKLLFIVMALGILAAAYFFGFTKLMDQASEIEASNQQDEALLTRLQDMVSRQAETVAETEGFKKTIKEIVKKYPSDIPQEKAIYLIQQTEDIVGVDYDSISFSMDNTILNISDGDKNLSGMFAALTLPYKGTYDQVKNLLDYVAEQKEDRTTIPNMTIAYDSETGGLRGSVTYRMYYLRNTDRKYEEFPDTEIPAGLSDIFHTVASEEENVVIEE